MQNKHDATNRVVVLVDMDCFYCQVEEKLNPVLAGKPLAVVQYNQWRGGGSVNVYTNFHKLYQLTHSLKI